LKSVYIHKYCVVSLGQFRVNGKTGINAGSKPRSLSIVV